MIKLKLSFTVLAFVLISIILPITANAEYIAGSDYKSRGWNGAAYTYDDTGDFSHCTISAKYKSGYTLLFALTKQYTMSLGFEHEKPVFVGQTSFPITLQVDRAKPFYVTGTAGPDNFVIVSGLDMDEALNLMRRGRILRFSSFLGNTEFNLTGTFRALDATYNCASRYFDYVSNSVPTQNEKLSSIDKGELYQMITHMLADLKMSDFRFLKASEAAEVMPGINKDRMVLWETNSKKIVGGVVVAHDKDFKDLKSTDPADLSYIAGLCNGDVMTSSVAVKDSRIPMRELLAICDENGETTKVFSNKFRHNDLTYYTVLMLKGEADELPKPKKSNRSLALKAVSFSLDE
ncbi:hypothetical protein N9C16_09570 [Paracoccaceae bacterium]|nr:hypothetical protein [Paracoccaceae bacterium]